MKRYCRKLNEILWYNLTWLIIKFTVKCDSKISNSVSNLKLHTRYRLMRPFFQNDLAVNIDYELMLSKNVLF